MADHPFPNRRPMTPLPEGIEWVNTTKAWRLDDFRGKFVLLDFWTYCCINCMHVLPELKKLEQAYPNHLVVLGVHTAKFDAERDEENIAEAVRRYGIEHPVINDADGRVWNRYGARAWPTLLLVDPEGYAVWGQSGETTFEALDAILKRALPYYRRQKVLDERPLQFGTKKETEKDTPLYFPGKVLADERGGRLFIADSGHNRIVVADFAGTLLETIGSGAAGRADGDYAAAQFNSPQGMALAGNTLYIADTENHLLRKVDLDERRVMTLAGTGNKLEGPPAFRRMRAPRASLASPWALCLDQGNLYIAMAGTHQIWRLVLKDQTIGPYAGNGREDIVDGPLRPPQPYQLGFASFAQPSGLASDGVWLYVADSEGSSIRAVPLDPKGRVRTLVGTEFLPQARLFTFGDVDGPPGQARFQHPLGVAYAEGVLYVADTYNNKIKTVDPATGNVATLLGGESIFNEPAGLSVAGGKLYVADTNHHQIRVVELRDDPAIDTFTIHGLQPPGVQ